MRIILATAVAACLPRATPHDAVERRFRVMPWDVGIATFKSDRYFALADLAQADFGVRTGLFGTFVRQRMRWVNLAQSARFVRPLRLLQPFTVTTRVVGTDGKHAYFSHRFTSAQGEHAEVLVKMKFKIGSRTVPPRQLLGEHPEPASPSLQALDALGAAGSHCPPPMHVKDEQAGDHPTTPDGRYLVVESTPNRDWFARLPK